MPSIFVLGGNTTTLAFTSSFREEQQHISAWLVPLAWTPIGVSLGGTWQRVRIASDAIAGWVDQTFPPEDERSFVASMRDVEMLSKLAWHAEPQSEIHEDAIINVDDLPEDIREALSEPAAELVPCAVCRRLCVKPDFVWNERRLCAWDFHSLVFGRRGPWRNEPYLERYFATLPAPRYLVPELLEEARIDVIASFGKIEETLIQSIVNQLIAADQTHAYLAARTHEGTTLLRERHTGEEPV